MPLKGEVLQVETGVILTIVTGRIYCSTLSKLQAALEHLTGQPVLHHVMSDAADFCRSYVLEQCPWAAELQEDPGPEDPFLRTTHAIVPIEGVVWNAPDPIAAMEGVVGRRRTIVVVGS